MLATIWAAFEPYLREIFKHNIAQSEKKNSWKRSAVGKFMSLYDAIVDLEKISISIYNEFSDIFYNNSAVTRTIIKDRLEKLSTASKHFVQSARAVNNILSIYNDDLSIMILGTADLKSQAWHVFDLLLDSLPKNVGEHGRLSSVIKFSNIIPTKDYVLSLGVNLNFPTHRQDELIQDANVVKKLILKELEFVHLNLSNKPELSDQLLSLSNTVNAISTMKKALAEFIKVSFPIDKILE